ncbi:unnamed protein product, partial [Amoebophrya sp. A25]|eukprot:GSA25T00003607001.1
MKGAGGMLSEDEQDTLDALVDEFARTHPKTGLQEILYKVHTGATLPEGGLKLMQKLFGKEIQTRVFDMEKPLDAEEVGALGDEKPAGAGRKSRNQTKKGVRQVTLYFQPTKHLHADLPGLDKMQSDFFLPICGNGNRPNRYKVIELGLDSLDDRNTKAPIHERVLMVVRNNLKTNDCFCSGMFPGCTAPGYPPEQRPFLLPEAQKSLKETTTARILGSMPRMRNLPLADTQFLEVSSSFTATPQSTIQTRRRKT